MNKKYVVTMSILLSSLFISTSGIHAAAPQNGIAASPIVAIHAPISPWEYQQRLGKGMDVDWSKTTQGKKYYSKQAVIHFKQAGVSHVRIRVADPADEQLLQALEQQIDDCLEVGIIPIIAYQADEFKNEPTEQNIQKVVNWWTKVANRFQDKSHLLAFDLLIEATDALNKQPEKLNIIFERLVTEIRKTNPTRVIMISPRLRSDADYLKELRIPSQHNNYLMAEWHFYASGPSKTNERKLWTTGTDAEKKLITDNITAALEWQKTSGIPTWVGAWMPSNYNDGDDYTIEEQVAFASFMTNQLTAAGIPFAVNSDTKYYDREKQAWISERLPVFNAIFQTAVIPGEPVPPGIQVGFNAKGSLAVSEQTQFLQNELKKWKEQNISTEKVWLRLQGGSISQKTYPEEWSDHDIREWVQVQKEYGVSYIFVVNFNDEPKDQANFYKRMTDLGMKFAFVELGNEQYLPKYRESKVDESEEVTKRTSGMTPKKYIQLSEEYIQAFQAFDLPYYIQFAPEKEDQTNTTEWNREIAHAINTNAFSSEKINGTLHLYERNGDGSLNEAQISDIKNLVKRPISIAITEYGVVDKKGKLTSQKRIDQEMHLTKRILNQLQDGDVLLNQLLYTDYKQVGGAVFHPDFDGLTPKGKNMVDLFKQYWTLP